MAAAASAESNETQQLDPTSDPDSNISSNTTRETIQTDSNSTSNSTSNSFFDDYDPDDFDHEFDDDFEAEIPGEYELDDDEYARALLDIVDFEIEGLEAYRDDVDETVDEK